MDVKNCVIIGAGPCGIGAAIELKKLGIKYVDSAGNFFLMSVAPFKGKEVFQNMLKEGVIIRAMDEYDLPDYVRVTVGTRKENELLEKS